MYGILSFYACCNNITQQYIIIILPIEYIVISTKFSVNNVCVGIYWCIKLPLPMFNSDLLNFSAPRKQCKFSTRKIYICYLLNGNEVSDSFIL